LEGRFNVDSSRPLRANSGHCGSLERWVKSDPSGRSTPRRNQKLCVITACAALRSKNLQKTFPMRFSLTRIRNVWSIIDKAAIAKQV
jgi:hypothetical protein